MKTIHPFPARMAPNLISEWLQDLPRGSKILDPMCGSGVVVRQALLHGHSGIGIDIDPLAVLMSKVWTRRINISHVREHAASIVKAMDGLSGAKISLNWIDECKETTKFINYWFARKQVQDLRRLSHLLMNCQSGRSQHINNLLLLALSKTIITKKVGASLAWDISHSRPHKVRTENEYDVRKGFIKSINTILSALEFEKLDQNGNIYQGDTRSVRRLKARTVDAIFTSPPYLNAIDYLRGHKFSLIWMGYTIPQIRKLRSTSVGTERSIDISECSHMDWKSILRTVPQIRKLPNRQQKIIARYSNDAGQLLGEFTRLLRPGGRLVLVLGDCCVRGHPIKNSRIYDSLAKSLGFTKIAQRKRTLEVHRRYLPLVSSNNSLENRMRHEIIQVYSL